MSDQFNLPNDFDFDQEVINLQFAIMLKLARQYDKRLIMEEKRLKELLRESFRDPDYIDKVYKRVYLRAYHTIPGEFWKNIKMPYQKP